MFSITPSHIIQYLYCPRFTYFEYVARIPQSEEKEYKVLQGRHLHELKSEQNRNYLRKRIGATDKRTEVYLTNNLLRGEVDEVLTLSDGTMAPLDYKFTKWEEKLYETYLTQLYCYAWLIEENFKCQVTRGFLIYTRSNHYVKEVKIAQKDIESIQFAAQAIQGIIQNNIFPRATSIRKRCVHCTYRNVCPR
jgi:CRISPR-associated exonuclease Cas4